MCGRFVATTPTASLMDRFRAVETFASLPPRWNVAPTDPAAVVVEADGGRVVDAYRWGLIPAWAGDDHEAARRINARAETLAERPSFRDAFVDRRCIIPVDGFYEWRRGDGRPEPYFIRTRGGDPVLAFAGLWSEWVPGRNGPPRLFDDLPAPPVRSCTIVTTAANDTMRNLHNRMPVVLAPDTWDEWLAADHHDPVALTHLLVGAPDDLLELVPVSTAVNDVRNDGPHLVETRVCS